MGANHFKNLQNTFFEVRKFEKNPMTHYKYLEIHHNSKSGLTLGEPV